MEIFRKFRQSYHFNWYILLWAISVVVVVYLFLNWHIDKQFIGIVERKSHQTGAQEPGKIKSMLVKVGEQVKKNQVLAMLDTADLHSHLSQLNNELDYIDEMAGTQSDYNSITTRRILLQIDNEASDLIDHLSDIESKNTELSGLNTEIDRLKNAEKAGLGYNRDLSSLSRQRDALASYLREQSKDLDTQKEHLEKIRQSRTMLEAQDADSLSQSLLIEQLGYRESLRREITATEHRIKLRTVLSPCDGYVTEMFSHHGDIVNEFDPVLVVEELKPRFLDVYIPESSTLALEQGKHIEILSARSKVYNTTGTITFVHPGFAQASERVSFRGQTFWARKVRVKLPEDHQLIPGEVVNVRILKNEHSLSHFPFLPVSAAQSGDSVSRPQALIQTMTVPDELWKRSRFEPSGISWLSDIGKYLIVSDDTGIEDSANDKSAIAFLMDEQGNVDDAPVRLTGVREVNDLEAIASDGENTLYIVSSQNISKKGRRPQNRELFIRVNRRGGTYIVDGQISFLSLLLATYSQPELLRLGLEKFDSDGKPVLNIEGAAYRDGSLYLGLKEPVSSNGAIIWKLDNVDDVLNKKRLLPHQLSVYGYVQLGDDSGRPAGISDLTFDQNGVLWALSTIPDADGENQTGGLHRINTFSDGHLEAIHMLDFPGKKPEGICSDRQNHLVIVFDADNNVPSFCHIDTEGL